MIEKINAEFIYLFIFLKVLRSLSESRFKALVHPKMKMMSLIVAPNP